MKVKQKLDKSEPYFVQIGYTYASEMVKYYRRGKGRKRHKPKMRDCVKQRLDKLKKYWRLALK